MAKRTFNDWTFKNRYYYFLIIIWTLFSYYGIYEEVHYTEIFWTLIASGLILLIPFALSHWFYAKGYRDAISEGKQ